jgi:aminocarboxymuconate-semialdehyde decarboxylase
MIIDVHSHFVPRALLQDPAFELSLAENSSGNMKIHAWGITVDALPEELFDVEKQLRMMAAEEIGQKVLSLPPFLFAYGKEPSFALKWCRESNDTLAGICAAHPKQFRALGIVPLQDPGAAVEELRRCHRELKFPGIEIGTQVRGQDLDQESLVEFFAEADRLGSRILIHPNNVSFGDRLSKFYLRNLVGNSMETTICASRLLLGGFFERHSRMSICLSHGGGTIPFLVGRLRHGSRVRPEIRRGEGPFHLPPNLHFDVVVHDGKALRYLIDQCVLNSVLLGTDSPFDMSLPDPVAFVREAVGADEQAVILESNPKRFLNS